MSGLDQERRVIEALVLLHPAETIESLRTASIRTIESLLNCSGDRAQEILNDLKERNRIEPEITPRGGSLDGRKRMPVGRLHWVCRSDV